jgi:tetratricopeptide (TPR) repeat protein
MSRWLSINSIQSAILVVLVALVVVIGLFSGYYYWDRYIHTGDKSTIDHEIDQMVEVIRENPHNPEARVVLAEVYLEKGMHKEALDQTLQVLDQYPDNEGALLISGITKSRQDQPQAAAEFLERFVALRKDQPMATMDTALEAAYYYLGISYSKLNQPNDAIPALEAALVIDRTDADALYQLGKAYQASGQPEVALMHYHEAVRFGPVFAEVYTGMTECYSSLNQTDFVKYAQGMEAFSLQDYEAAKNYLEHATRELPEFGPAFLGLGLTYEKIGDQEAALAAIHRSLELNPEDFAAQQTLGRIQISIDQ